MNAGSWVPAPFVAGKLPEKAASAYGEAVAGLAGASYIPLLYCGEQVVAGMNYMIICGQTLVTNPPEGHVVKMVIHEPLEGKATIRSIETIL